MSVEIDHFLIIVNTIPYFYGMYKYHVMIIWLFFRHCYVGYVGTLAGLCRSYHALFFNALYCLPT